MCQWIYLISYFWGEIIYWLPNRFLTTWHPSALIAFIVRNLSFNIIATVRFSLQYQQSLLKQKKIKMIILINDHPYTHRNFRKRLGDFHDSTLSVVHIGIRWSFLIRWFSFPRNLISDFPQQLIVCFTSCLISSRFLSIPTPNGKLFVCQRTQRQFMIPFVKCVHFFCVRNSLQTLLLTVLSSHGFEFFHYLIFYLFINFTITSDFSWSIMMTFSFINFFNTHLSRSSENSLMSFLSSSKTFSYLPAYFISFITTGYQSAVIFPFDYTFLKTVHQLFRWFLEIQGRLYLGL